MGLDILKLFFYIFIFVINNFSMDKKYIIYKYTSPSGGIYIGQTSKESIEERSRRDGSGYLVLNKMTGNFLQPGIANAIMKYGWDNFKKEILYTNLTSEEADKIERDLIEECKNVGVCYNITRGGKDGVDTPKERKIKQYTLSGDFIKEWSSIKEAEHFLGIKKAEGNISACCSGKKSRAYGYIWRYENSNLEIKPLRPYRSSVCQFKKNGEYIATYSNIREASKITGANESGIGNVLHKRTKTCGGYIWKFRDECDLL